VHAHPQPLGPTIAVVLTENKIVSTEKIETTSNEHFLTLPGSTTKDKLSVMKKKIKKFCKKKQN
jgi:hypothetical protein